MWPCRHECCSYQSRYSGSSLLQCLVSTQAPLMWMTSYSQRRQTVGVLVSWALNRSLRYVCGGKWWQGVGSRLCSLMADEKKKLELMATFNFCSPQFTSCREGEEPLNLQVFSVTKLTFLWPSPSTSSLLPPAVTYTEVKEGFWPVISLTSFISAFLLHSFFLRIYM